VVFLASRQSFLIRPWDEDYHFWGPHDNFEDPGLTISITNPGESVGSYSFLPGVLTNVFF
jgi:hypothetical protein